MENKQTKLSQEETNYVLESYEKKVSIGDIVFFLKKKYGKEVTYGGINSMLLRKNVKKPSLKRNARPSLSTKITVAQELELVEEFKKKPMTRTEIAAYLKSKYGVTFTCGGISAILVRNGIDLKTVERSSYTRSDKTSKKIPFEYEAAIIEEIGEIEKPIVSAKVRVLLTSYGVEISNQGLIDFMKRIGYVQNNGVRQWVRSGT